MNDCIRRQEAIDDIEKWRGYIDDDMVLRMVIRLRALPSAQPEPHWIPCSERLPEYYDWYLVSNKGTSWVALWNNGVFLSVSGYFEFNDIIAWMPLPEPYEEGKP